MNWPIVSVKTVLNAKLEHFETLKKISCDKKYLVAGEVTYTLDIYLLEMRGPTFLLPL